MKAYKIYCRNKEEVRQVLKYAYSLGYKLHDGWKKESKLYKFHFIYLGLPASDGLDNNIRANNKFNKPNVGFRHDRSEELNMQELRELLENKNDN